MRRIWLLLLVLACKGRDDANPAPAPARSPPVAARPGTPTPKPALPAPETEAPPAAPQTAEQQLAAEPVDPSWHAQTEREIKHRVPAASDIECHTTQCRVTVSSPQDLDALHGYAQAVLLTAPAKQADGKTSVRAIVRFDR